MEPNRIWKRRWSSDSSPILKKYMEVVCRKKSAVCLAADRYKMDDLFQLLGVAGPHIAALKTHVDLISDWDKDRWKDFCHEAKELDLLIFEDRKFADIGKISKKQMGGIYDIQSWSDLVTAHLISGSDITTGIQSAWKESHRIGGILLWPRCRVEEIFSMTNIQTRSSNFQNVMKVLLDILEMVLM